MSITFTSSDGKFDLTSGENSRKFNITFSDGTTTSINANFASSNKAPTNYNGLFNKPKINNTTLEGNIMLSQLGLRAIYYDTTSNWNMQPSLISEEGALYIYSDHQMIEDDVGNITYIPGLRIGDGTTYLIDLPFLSTVTTQAFYEHVNDIYTHVTPESRELWDNKVSSYLNASDPENLVLSKNNYIVEGDIYNG